MNDVILRLNDVFRRTFGDETIELEDSMTVDDVEAWDSVTHITLIFAVEEEFGVTFSIGDLENLENVGDLREALFRQL